MYVLDVHDFKDRDLTLKRTDYRLNTHQGSHRPPEIDRLHTIPSMRAGFTPGAICAAAAAPIARTERGEPFQVRCSGCYSLKGLDHGPFCRCFLQGMPASPNLLHIPSGRTRAERRPPPPTELTNVYRVIEQTFSCHSNLCKSIVCRVVITPRSNMTSVHRFVHQCGGKLGNGTTSDLMRHSTQGRQYLSAVHQPTTDGNDLKHVD